MIDELLRKVADCLGQEIQEDARVEICLTVFGREHLVIESFSVRLAKALTDTEVRRLFKALNVTRADNVFHD